MEKALEMFTFPRVNQREIENMKKQNKTNKQTKKKTVTSNGIESVI